MPEYLLFRPPRRNPRVLAAVSKRRRLAIAVVDPWELRFLSERKVCDEPAKKRLEQCKCLIRETLARERPHALAIAADKSTASKALSSILRDFKILSVRVSPKTFSGDCLQRLPQRHLTPELFKSDNLKSAAALAHAGLSHFLSLDYDKRNKNMAKRA